LTTYYLFIVVAWRDCFAFGSQVQPPCSGRGFQCFQSPYGHQRQSKHFNLCCYL